MTLLDAHRVTCECQGVSCGGDSLVFVHCIEPILALDRIGSLECGTNPKAVHTHMCAWLMFCHIPIGIANSIPNVLLTDDFYKGNESFSFTREIKSKGEFVMENMKVLKVYNFVNDKGNTLQLELGVGDRTPGEYPYEDKDNGLRWRFYGSIIPMPVRSGYWFNGFAENIMLDWLKGNGWYPRTCVNMATGRARVYELPKGNEESEEFPIHYSVDKNAFNDAICFLYENGKRITAVRAYRYTHGGNLNSAAKAVREICCTA